MSWIKWQSQGSSFKFVTERRQLPFPGSPIQDDLSRYIPSLFPGSFDFRNGGIFRRIWGKLYEKVQHRIKRTSAQKVSGEAFEGL